MTTERLLAYFMGVGHMIALPEDVTFSQPNWLANIESAFSGCLLSKSYLDYLYMLEHWFAPAAEEYMEDLHSRNSDVSSRLLAVLTSLYAVDRQHAHPALRAAGHAARRLINGGGAVAWGGALWV